MTFTSGFLFFCVPSLLKKMSQSCGSFARSVLVDCPADIEQRLTDGLSDLLAPFHANCGVFDFQAMLNAQDPTAHLPVLFSSLNYQSPNTLPTNVPLPADAAVVWYGLSPSTWFPALGSSPPNYTHTWCYKTKPWGAQNTARAFYYNTDPNYRPVGWFEALLFHSTDTMLVVQYQPTILQFPGNITIFSDSSTVTYDIVISGDNSTVCKMDLMGGWARRRGDVWTTLNFQPKSTLSLSFDGSNLCASNGQQVNYLIEGVYGSLSITGQVYTAVLGSMAFIGQGSVLSTIGSLKSLKQLKQLGGSCTGVWCDDLVVYVATTVNTFMSYDGGWTWVTQTNKVAIGAGVYKDVSGKIWSSAQTTFQEDVGFPLRITNSGLLYSSTWKNWYQFTDLDDKLTTIDQETAAAISPNGRYLATVGEDVTVYLNVWNLPLFWTWCARNNNVCMDGYRRYCQLVNISPDRCSPIYADEPPVDEPPVDDPPVDDRPADDPPASSNNSLKLIVGAIVGIWLVMLILWLFTR